MTAPAPDPPLQPDLLEKEALTAKTDSARIRAIELLGKHLGLFTDRLETKDVTEHSADEIEAQIRMRLEQHLI